MTSRRRIVAGNWKLNHGPTETRAFFDAFLPQLPRDLDGTVALFPPSVSVTTARDALNARPDVRLGVQNVYWESTGAFTGEISASMAADAGASFVLVGHSERRHVFGESDEETARKLQAIVDQGITAVLCVGETLEQREAGSAIDVVKRQLGAIASDGEPLDPARLVIAYEPVWAIGTGRTATPEDASDMHLRVRTSLQEFYRERADSIAILYGGSVKVENAAALIGAPGIDGLLIGGASLDPIGFARICRLLA